MLRTDLGGAGVRAWPGSDVFAPFFFGARFFVAGGRARAGCSPESSVQSSFADGSGGEESESFDSDVSSVRSAPLRRWLSCRWLL